MSVSTANAYKPLLSVIICSIDDDRFARVARNYRELLALIPHEILRVDDAVSLAEGYNRGIARSCGAYLILSHDDIEIWTPDFGERLLRHLNCCDMAGVAGTDLLVNTGCHSKTWKYTSWGAAGLGHVFGQIVLPLQGGYAIQVYGAPAALVEGMQALDGVLIAMRRSVAETLRFDDENFDGFHLYDLDFTYRAFQNGFNLGVLTDIVVVHHSEGRYDEQWLDYHRRFLSKFENVLPKTLPRAWQQAFVVFQRPSEVLDFYGSTAQRTPQFASPTGNQTANRPGDFNGTLDPAFYRRWCEWQQRWIEETWAEIVAERWMKRWWVQPTFHLVIWCEPGQQAALADTLESFGQQLYDRWGVSVLAPFECPDAGFAELPNLEWVKVEADADAALRGVLEASALDWFTLLEPGDRLAPHALLKSADYINRDPAWRFIYFDEDQLDARGQRCDPVFRPDFDPELLLATHYLGDCCLMHRDSVLADDALAYVPGVTTFQAALRVLKEHGRAAIGHIADVLYHRSFARSQVADVAAIARMRQQLAEERLTRRKTARVAQEGLLPGA
ncbi:MAG TPA: glycosyltransferase [Candidatus Competibacter sp.]|nr:glycosyltransferase [Candidatus Competibacter sp.]